MQAHSDRVVRQLDELPAPPGLPVLGQLLALDVPRRHQILEGWEADLGSPCLLRMGPRRVYVSGDAALLQTVLRERPGRYRRLRPIEDGIAELGANGEFSVEGEAWRPQRRLVMEALDATHLRGFFPTLQAVTARLHRRWSAAAARGETVEMPQDLVRFAVDVTTALAFGEDPNTLDSDGDVIQEQLALVFPRLMARIDAPLPYWRYVKRPQDRALERIHAHVDALIARARQRLATEPAGAPRNVLEATANEATRLKPIVPVIFLEPNVDVVLDGVALPAGTPRFFLLRPAMLDERHFADPLACRPECWAHDRPVGVHDTGAFVQFGAGPRACPGRQLAGVEIRLALSMLLAHFRLELAANPAAIREVMAFTMTPDRMPVRLTARH